MMTMGTKEDIEAFVATEYLARTLPNTFDPHKFVSAAPPKPDVIYGGNIGIEVGYVGLPQNIAGDIQEQRFVKQLNDVLGQRIRADVEVDLIMQDDKDIVDHTPVEEMGTYLPGSIWSACGYRRSAPRR